MARRNDKDLPLIYACSGASNVAQLANRVAVRLDRSGMATMSCIAGVGGDVPSLVKVAQSGRPIVAVDGCHLACTRQSLARHGVTPARHHVLTEQGWRKRYHRDFSEDDVNQAMAAVLADWPRQRSA